MSHDDLIVVTSYYNPQHYKNRLKNYKLFQARLNYQDLPCITVECVLGDDFPELEPGPDVITVRTRDSIWQKERLLNIAIDHVDPQYTKIAWLDCDVLFMDYKWTDKTSALLDEYQIIQPWNRAAFLTPEGPDAKVNLRYWASFAQLQDSIPIPARHGHCGFGWAARRDLLVKHHLYDAAIIGHGDHLIGHAVHGDLETDCIDFHIPTPEFKSHFQKWGRRFYEDVQGKTISLLGEVRHLWHGEISDRRYKSRHAPLKDFEFNPETDIRINAHGAWEWASDKPELHQWVAEYFKGRQEDGRPDEPSVQEHRPSYVPNFPWMELPPESCP